MCVCVHMRACVYVKESARTLLSVSACGEFVGSHPSVGGRGEIVWILEPGPPEYSWAMATDWLDFGQDDSAACLGFPTPELGTVMSPLERYSEDSMRFCKTSSQGDRREICAACQDDARCPSRRMGTNLVINPPDLTCRRAQLLTSGHRGSVHLFQ